MPESKKRKPRKQPNRAQPPRRSPVPKISAADLEPLVEAKKASRDPAQPLSDEMLFSREGMPEPATYDQVLMHLADADPLAQEVMLASRLAAMPSQRDGSMPVNIHRAVRAPWARHLRKLGVFVIPELATHELVAPDASGIMQNHTAATLRRIDSNDLWKTAREQNPDLAKLVDEAKTPEQKREAAAKLLAKMPVEQRVALRRLESHRPEELEPR